MGMRGVDNPIGICMMASFYYQDQNAVNDLYCQANFPIVYLLPKEKSNLNKKEF